MGVAHLKNPPSTKSLNPTHDPNEPEGFASFSNPLDDLIETAGGPPSPSFEQDNGPPQGFDSEGSPTGSQKEASATYQRRLRSFVKEGLVEQAIFGGRDPMVERKIEKAIWTAGFGTAEDKRVR